MANDLHSPPGQTAQNPPEQNVTTLVTGILNDAQELFRQQVNLIRKEVTEDFRKSKEAAIPMAVGMWLGLLGSILLSVALAVGLAQAGWLDWWASFGLVGVALAAAGGGLFYFGKKKFASFNPLPDESAKALEENLQWLAKPK